MAGQACTGENRSLCRFAAVLVQDHPAEGEIVIDRGNPPTGSTRGPGAGRQSVALRRGHAETGVLHAERLEDRQELGQVERQLTPLEEERRRIWTKLSLIVEELGGKVKVEGVGRLAGSKASCCVNDDRKEVDALILTLINHGHEHFADALRVCKRESVRPGTVRVLRELPR